MTLIPDWVCEIVSPGHERQGYFELFLLLQRHRVPFYWIIWPEDRVLIAYRLVSDSYRVIETITEQNHARIPLFEDVELNLAFLLGTT